MDQNYFGKNENIPEEIREVFMWLCQDIASLFQMWDFYEYIFEKKENAELLAQHIPNTLIIIGRSLRISMVMAICRLNDPSTEKNNLNNISLARLAEYGPKNKVIIDLCSKFKEACKPFEIYRNKRFAHRDLITTLDFKGNIFPGISRKSIEKVLGLSSEIINIFAQQFSDSEYQFHVKSSGGPDQFLYWFKKGLAANK